MDFVSILKSKQHNFHYLNRYIKFINYLLNNPSNNEYTENHHICPKSKDMFPQFKNFTNHPWNKIKLSYRQHIIAHYLLMKSYNNESQTLSVILTNGQFHQSKKIYHSRLVEQAKINLSKLRKGKFTRGYYPDGTPRVSNQTKQLISKQKTEYYKNPENRKKQSIACMGTKNRISQKYKLAAQNRTNKHLKNISKGIKKYYASLSDIQKKRINSGIYITPFGNFTSLCRYGDYCKNNLKKFTKHNVKKNPYLNSSIIGKTPLELGFNFISKNDPTIEQYYVDLNLIRQPEPNHPLLLELNDYLLQQKFHS
jgi:hypothetical protein